MKLKLSKEIVILLISFFVSSLITSISAWYNLKQNSEIYANTILLELNDEITIKNIRLKYADDYERINNNYLKEKSNILLIYEKIIGKRKVSNIDINYLNKTMNNFSSDLGDISAYETIKETKGFGSESLTENLKSRIEFLKMLKTQKLDELIIQKYFYSTYKSIKSYELFCFIYNKKDEQKKQSYLSKISSFKWQTTILNLNLVGIAFIFLIISYLIFHGIRENLFNGEKKI